MNHFDCCREREARANPCPVRPVPAARGSNYRLTLKAPVMIQLPVIVPSARARVSAPNICWGRAGPRLMVRPARTLNLPETFMSSEVGIGTRQVNELNAWAAQHWSACIAIGSTCRVSVSSRANLLFPWLSAPEPVRGMVANRYRIDKNHIDSTFLAIRDSFRP